MADILSMIHIDGGFVVPQSVVAYQSKSQPPGPHRRSLGTVYLESGHSFETNESVSDILEKIDVAWQELAE